ncbi:MAG: M36 family metallopeptidase [Acidobacteria bacterium]|nr:M36 family metallopeptidase [Acidobacteriota bacterium]MCB9399465.1 M36 family metallopeptidase [Acidobacteriota bacterium]
MSSVFVLISLFLFSSNPDQDVLRFVERNAGEWGLTATDISNLAVQDIVEDARGNQHVYLVQTVNGIPIHGALFNASLNSNGEIIHFGNRLVKNIENKIRGSVVLSPQEAIGRSATFVNQAVGPLQRLGNVLGAEQAQVWQAPEFSRSEVNLKLVYFPVGDQLILAWAAEVSPIGADQDWILMVDAESGTELGRVSLTVSDVWDGPFFGAPNAGLLESNTRKKGGNAYLVFPFPAESPNHGTLTLVSDPFDLTASPFGWHDTNGVVGAEFTTTEGNNVHAYQDRDGNDIPSIPNDDPDGGPGLVFNFPINLNDQPVDYLEGATVNLFYWNNIIHDLLYHFGFDEAAGNFQENNYGNGGNGSDSVNAQSQSRADQPPTGTTRNNANFSTPTDGGNPRMRMYEWLPIEIYEMEITAPVSLAGTYPASGALFGVQLPQAGMMNNLVLAQDGTGASVTDGCEAFTNAGQVNGKIAILDRGNCNFTQKVQNAEAAGATACIVINNQGDTLITMGATSPPTINIPAIMIYQSLGEAIKTALGNNETVTIELRYNTTSPVRDSDLDAGIIAHEYGHGVSNRLTGGPGNTSCLQNEEQMGEGWSDFLGLYFTSDPAHTELTVRGIGTYASFQPLDGPGIRPRPYTYDFTVNEKTYQNLPDGDISVPHGVGFIWCTMLYDMYWNLVDKHGYDADLYQGTGGNNLALTLVMDGMKLQPCSPGFVDGRDAILAADVNLTAGANRCEIWRAFARRGLGFSASQGSSGSRSDGTAAFDLPCDCSPINRESDGASLCAGEDITLQVQTMGTITSYQWRKNGMPIIGQTGTTLVLTNLTAGDSGNYDCVVTNACNSFPSSGMTITVTEDVFSLAILPFWNDVFSNSGLCTDVNANNRLDVLDLSSSLP